MTIDNFSKTRIKGSMLQVNHMHLSYGPRLVLDDVSFSVAPGEKAGLIGVNGAGKSSLLRIIAGLFDADGGTVMLPRTYGYLSQDVAHEDPVAGEGTVRDFIFSISGLDLGGVTLERYVRTLSGGQKTKLALVRLLFQAPNLLLLDAPTNFPDVE